MSSQLHLVVGEHAFLLMLPFLGLCFSGEPLCLPIEFSFSFAGTLLLPFLFFLFLQTLSTKCGPEYCFSPLSLGLLFCQLELCGAVIRG